MKRTQNYPINLTKSGAGQKISNENMVHYELEEYFKNISIGLIETKKKHYVRNFQVPVIALFTNEEYREAFLNFTKDNTDSEVKKFRNILSDEYSRKNHYCLMVERIGDTLKKYKVETFVITTLEYTKKNYNHDGRRQKYYLNINGVKLKDAKTANGTLLVESETKDLTELYFRIKQLRAKSNEALKQETLRKNA